MGPGQVTPTDHDPLELGSAYRGDRTNMYSRSLLEVRPKDDYHEQVHHPFFTVDATGSRLQLNSSNSLGRSLRRYKRITERHGSLLFLVN